MAKFISNTILTAADLNAAFTAKQDRLDVPYSTLELGDTLTASSVSIKFHTSSRTVDFDSIITASGGSTVIGSGNLFLKSSNISFVADTMKLNNNPIIHSGNIGSGLIWDGSVLTANAVGSIQYILPSATNTTLGGVKIDNSSITITSGVISGRPIGIGPGTVAAGDDTRINGAIQQANILSVLTALIASLPTIQPTSSGILWIDGKILAIS